MINRYKNRAAFVVVLMLLVGLGACTLPEQTHKNPAGVVKSDNDQREYRFVELPNKLRVLLINDPDTDKSAASLDVYVGSRDDPQAHQGLAHFLEHMLFLGTQKYPQAGEYQAFINSHNGSHNAYTSFEHTNYFFDIDPAHLDEALDRFSRFFIEPLFTQTYVEREKNAVHSEYMAKIKTDQRKSLDVFKSVINPAHPFAKFSVGNLDTLKVTDPALPDLREQLKQFYATHYSANVMTLVVLGRESLDELQAMVSTKFAAIANSDKSVVAIEEPLFSKGTLPLSITIQPEQEQRVLSIVFPTEDETPYYRQKPLHYLGNIIGHEGQGSLLSYLKEQGLAEGLSAGSGLRYKGGGSFVVTIMLTKKGVAQADHIVTAVFQTVNRIKQSGITRWLFEEQSTLASQQFKYLEKSSPIHYVSAVSANLHYYPAWQVLSAPYLMRDYSSRLIKRFLGYLTPVNAVITLSAPGVEVDRRSHFYQTPYKAQPVSGRQLARWQNAGINPRIILPAANEFIAQDLRLHTNHTAQSEDAAASGDKTPAVPALLIDNDAMRLWFKPDDQFAIPKASVFFSVRSARANDTPGHSVLLEMFTGMVSDELNEFSYPATLAGLHYGIKPHNRGFSVKIGGFNDKQSILLEKIIQAVTSASFKPQRFEDIKRDRIRQLQNKEKLQPYALLTDKLPQLLYRNQWSDQQLLAAYKTIDLQDLRDFAQRLLSAVDINVLVHGNYTEKQARKLGDTIEQALQKKPATVPALQIAHLPQAEFVWQVDSIYSDASLLFYLQGADLNKSTRAAMGITAHWLRSDFYTQLRTEKQLGYIVMAGAYPVLDVPGMIFLVQSPVAGPVVLQQEINQFIAQKLRQIDHLPEAVFNQHRLTLIQRLSESAKNLSKQSGRYWRDITAGYAQFDSREQLISALQQITFSQWKQFFRQQIAAPERAGVWMFTAGKFVDQALPGAGNVDDISVEKNRGVFYSFP